MLKIIIGDSKPECPAATQDIKKNLKNRQHAIDEYGYGPPNPEEPNDEFWNKKADMWNVEPEKAKTMLCGNCGAFNKSRKMLKCIKKGLKGNEESEPDSFEEVIDKADLGYCQMYKFKCAASRTCDSWITGGPITK
jgi:hypothetical protein